MIDEIREKLLICRGQQEMRPTVTLQKEIEALEDQLTTLYAEEKEREWKNTDTFQ